MQLETNFAGRDETPAARSGGKCLMLTPPVSDAYWLFRVKLIEQQSLLAFPKFGTIGIGFAKEEDWNTNLPHQCETEKIWQHIKHNRLDASEEDCIAAIKLLQEACKEATKVPAKSADDVPEQKDKTPLTFEQAVVMLPDGDTIKTLRNPGLGILVERIIEREELLALLPTASEIGLAGHQAKEMGYGMAAKIGKGWLFVETRKDANAS